MSTDAASHRQQITEAEYRQLCKTFAEREIAPRWEDAARRCEFPREVYTQAARAGLIGITAPEELGGAALGLTHEVIATEELCRADASLGVLPLVQNIANALLYNHGNEVHRDIARRNIAGECLLGMAVTEPDAGNDINVKMTAVRDGDDWVLNGTKALITLGGEADVMVLAAQTDPSQGRKGMRFFAVDRGTPGYATQRIPSYAHRSMPLYTVTLTDVVVPESRRVESTFYETMREVNRERVMMGARWLGHMQHALEWAVEYANMREAFGRPIGANQSIAFSLAQSRVEIEATRQLTYHVAREWDAGRPMRELVLDICSAKLFACQAVVRVTQRALHVAGGWGVTEGLPVMPLAIEAFAAAGAVGSDEIQLQQIARQMGLPCD